MEKIGVVQEDGRWLFARMEKQGSSWKLLEIDAAQNLPKFKGEIVTGLMPEDHLMRHFRSPLKKRGALLATLPFQVESLLPEKNLIVLPQIQRDADGSKVVLFACHEKRLEEHRRLFGECDVLSTLPLALMRFSQEMYPDEEEMLALHFFHEKILVVAMDRKGIKKFLTVKRGEPEYLDKAIEYLLSGGFLSPDYALVWSGEEGNLPKTPRELKIWEGLKSDLLRKFALPIGLALEGLYDDSLSLQFLQGKAISPKVRKKHLQQAIHITATWVAILSILTIAFYIRLQRKKSEINQEILRLYSTLSDQPAATSGKVSLAEVDKLLRQQKVGSKLYAMPPRVSDFLAKLDANPLLQAKDVEIKEVNFELLEYPTIKHANRNYLAKVNLVLEIKRPEHAEKFHDFLLQESHFVNKKREMTWNRNHDEYSTSFFL